MSSKAPYGTSGAPTKKVMSELEAAASRARIGKTLLEAAMPISTTAKDFWGDPAIGSRMVNVPKNPSKSFAVKPIKNGYLVLANSEEFYCADLATVGAQVVAIMAAHMME